MIYLIDARPVDNALTFLLEHLPPQRHAVITTREDPNIPLARYRAGGQLTELRVADSSFTPTESAALLNQMMGLKLPVDVCQSINNCRPNERCRRKTSGC